MFIVTHLTSPMWLDKDGLLYFSRLRATTFDTRSKAESAIKRTIKDRMKDNLHGVFTDRSQFYIYRCYQPKEQTP